jgi:hypothetical protein
MLDPQHALLKVPDSPLSDRPPQNLVRIDGQLYQMQLLSQPQPQPIQQEATRRPKAEVCHSSQSIYPNYRQS